MSEIKMRFIGRQQAPYGDAKTIWEIESNLPEDMVMEFCQREILSNRYMPTYEEWKKATGTGGNADMEYYFRGYVELIKYDNGVWRFVKTLPNTD